VAALKSLDLRPALVALCVALPVLAFGQSVSSGARVPQADLRVGSLRTADSPDPLTDGGMRTIATPSATTPVPMALAKDYRLSPSDLLDVEVLDADNLRRTVRVNAAGAISLPLIGRIVIAGMTTQEAEDIIAAKYSEKYLQNPQVSIFVKEFTTERITIEGAVQRPGIFPLAGQMTLLRALAVAGGFGPIADISQVMLYRVNDQKVRESFVYDVEKIRAGKAEDPPVRGDDLIVVQRDSARAVLKDSLLRDVIDSINPFSVFAPH
jgi:polysaccharide export outer membrane protein